MKVILFLILPFCHGETFSVRLVDGKATTNIVAIRKASQILPQQPIPPATGPSAVVDALQGRCFFLPTRSYEYSVCPFRMVTQMDKKTIEWNGVSKTYSLGVWSTWQKTDATIATVTEESVPTTRTMVFLGGADCGAHGKRKTNVRLVCDPKLKGKHSLISVTENSTCNYLAILKTSSICSQSELRGKPKAAKQEYVKETKSTKTVVIPPQLECATQDPLQCSKDAILSHLNALRKAEETLEKKLASHILQVEETNNILQSLKKRRIRAEDWLVASFKKTVEEKTTLLQER
eukprot:g6113.t1